MMKPSRRPYDNSSENFTPLNAKHVDILREVYRLKLDPEPPRPKRVNAVLGKDVGAWYAYHRLKGHYTNDCHHLKREIETLLQRVSYVKETKGAEGKMSLSKRESYSENTSTKKGKNEEEIRETRVTQHFLNTILGGFFRGGETSSSRKRYARPIIHISLNQISKKEGKPIVVGFSK